MSKATRKHITPGVLVTALGVVVALALMAAGVWLPGAAQAQSGPPSPFAPAAPTGVTATEASGPQVNVSWTAGSGGAAVTGYEVERKVGSGNFESADPAHTGTTPSYEDTNVESGMTYTYRVRANSGSNSNSDWVESNSVTVTASVVDVDLDEVPGFTIGHGGEAQQVSVDWDAVTDAHEYIVEYRLCSAEPCSGTFTMKTLSAANTMYLITGLNAGSQYQVRVTANNAAGMALAQSSGLVSTSRYLLTFANDGVTPSRGHAEDFEPTVDAGADTTVTATVWVPETSDTNRTDTVTVQFMSMDDTADPLKYHGIDVDDREQFTTLGLLAVSGTGTGHGELTIRPRDNDRRSFDMTFECTVPATKVYVIIYDDEANVVERGSVTLLCPAAVTPTPDDDEFRSDMMTVVSYNDWDHHTVVTDGFIIDDPKKNVEHMVTQYEKYNQMGVLVRDEPVVESYQLAISEMENLGLLPGSAPRRTKVQAEEGQHTIEVQVGMSDVQLTVTSTLEGPAYIRFLDSDMQPFGTDVDEEPMWRGADVVGLDSQSRLDLNLMPDLSKAKALAYDQYRVVIPGLATGNAYLDGVAGSYYQGAFRFFNPCPSEDHHFYVEVYESEGKYLKTTEKVLCVLSPRPGPAGLVFEIDSKKAGQGVLRFEPARNAVSHDVLLIDASNRNIVRTVPDAASPVTFNNLNNGWTYHIVVIAEGVDSQYTADGVKDYGVRWLGVADVPLSGESSAEPTRMHPLCQVDDADVMALLADCDEDPVNAAPMAVGTIAPATVTAGQMSEMDVSGYFSDADMDDTLTYTAMSDMTSYATVSVRGSMVTINGVAAGSAIVTVTATDAAGASAMQTIMVTVEAADMTLGAPGGVMSSDATTDPGTLLVKVDWTPGNNAVGHLVMLFTDDWQGAPMVEGTPTGNSHTFTVDAGSYIAVVVAYDVDGSIQLTISGVTTVGGS